MWSRVVSEPALTCKGEQEPPEKEKNLPILVFCGNVGDASFSPREVYL